LIAGAFAIGIFVLCMIYGFIRYKCCEDNRQNQPGIDNHEIPISADRFAIERKEPSRFMKFGEVDCAICFESLKDNIQLIQLMCAH
jgi:hypothetical protein